MRHKLDSRRRKKVFHTVLLCFDCLLLSCTCLCMPLYGWWSGPIVIAEYASAPFVEICFWLVCENAQLNVSRSPPLDHSEPVSSLVKADVQVLWS